MSEIIFVIFLGSVVWALYLICRNAPVVCIDPPNGEDMVRMRRQWDEDNKRKRDLMDVKIEYYRAKTAQLRGETDGI